MKKLLTILAAGLLLTSCSKQTTFDELEVLNITSEVGSPILLLSGKHVSINQGERLQVLKSDYSSIELKCLFECKVNVNGAVYYGSVKLK